MAAFGTPRRRRRTSLTAMIDVVFLLLVFFMLASRFGAEGAMTLGLAAPGQGATWSGPPRLVDVGPGGYVLLNGVQVAPEALPAALAALMAGPDDAVMLRVREGASVADLLALADLLRGAGLGQVLLLP